MCRSRTSTGNSPLRYVQVDLDEGLGERLVWQPWRAGASRVADAWAATPWPAGAKSQAVKWTLASVRLWPSPVLHGYPRRTDGSLLDGLDRRSQPEVM